MSRNFPVFLAFFSFFRGLTPLVRVVLGLGLSLGMVAPVAAAPVEATHPVAGFLRRLEEKGVIAPGFLSTLPRDQREIVGALREARRQQAALGAWDRRRLERYLDELDPARREGSRLR